MLTDWNFWFSIVTAAVAVLALVQTKQQIRLGNKQHLFDKRVEHYLIAKGLIQLYERDGNLLENKENEPIMAMDFIFGQMTNNTYLEKIQNVIGHPLEQPYQKEFLMKLEAMKDVAARTKFIFSGKAAFLLGNFVLYYQELLLKMYQYQVFLNIVRKTAKENMQTFEEARKAVREEQQRMELQEAINNLKYAYDMLKKENVEEKIEKQIKLK